MEPAPRIEFESDVFSPRGLTLLVDGSAQSHVDLADPTRLFFEYVRRVGHVIDHHGERGAPIDVLHLGGGALTLPRYVAATRPRSRQVVVDFDAELVAVVRARAPWPAASGIEVRVADAQDAVREAAARRERFDLVIVDLYTHLDAPAFVDDPAFLGACLALLRPGGLVVVNIADAAGLARLRTAARALARAAPGGGLLAAGDTAVLDGSEEGNAVLVAAPGSMPVDLAGALAAGGPFPATVLEGDRLDFVLWGAC
ncbi:spermidine synthase [Agromyces salentinus]|uniref:Fused MFS/spermidine synthase n=1 Tax=Agromyces salentinus TaxID=269421 RepID=A0ABP4Z7I8_9MICO|nr:fused MFS/spermidine synthase [Agromyces salentinus]